MSGWKAAYSTCAAFPTRRYRTNSSPSNSTSHGAAPDCRWRRRRCGIEDARIGRVGKIACRVGNDSARAAGDFAHAVQRHRVTAWARMHRQPDLHTRHGRCVRCILAHPTAARLAMTTRREFLEIAAATAAIAPGGWPRAFAQQQLSQADLLRFDELGNVTLVHIADLHAQLVPVYFREAAVNIGVGEARGRAPHVTGAALLERYGIPPASAAAYALSPDDFTALAKAYGRMGGLDRIATVLEAIRAERGEKVVFLDGGDTWQNSYTSLVSKGRDMVDCMAMLRPDAMVGHWEFTLGAERVKELTQALGFPFLGLNVRDTEWNEPVFPASTMLERGGVKIAVLGQAYPYTPIANPRWMIPNWSFGIREGEVRADVEKARAAGAELVVLLSHNGFDVDRKLAGRVAGIDVVLT